jgi:2-iminobutanoate/2-iminopropanoate deaminase
VLAWGCEDGEMLIAALRSLEQRAEVRPPGAPVHPMHGVSTTPEGERDCSTACFEEQSALQDPPTESGTPSSDSGSLRPLAPSGVLPPELPFSEGIVAGDLVFLSGQIGNRPGTLELAAASDEFRQVMESIMTALRANGLSPAHVVTCTVMLADMRDWPAFNEVYRGYFDPSYPARSAFATNGLAFGARAEVECIAHRSAARG